MRTGDQIGDAKTYGGRTGLLFFHLRVGRSGVSGRIRFSIIVKTLTRSVNVSNDNGMLAQLFSVYSAATSVVDSGALVSIDCTLLSGRYDTLMNVLSISTTGAGYVGGGVTPELPLTTWRARLTRHT